MVSPALSAYSSDVSPPQAKPQGNTSKSRLSRHRRTRPGPLARITFKCSTAQTLRFNVLKRPIILLCLGRKYRPICRFCYSTEYSWACPALRTSSININDASALRHPWALHYPSVFLSDGIAGASKPSSAESSSSSVRNSWSTYDGAIEVSSSALRSAW